MLNENAYEVKTFWGWFRLDEEAYKDYLAGKLWLTWVPGHLRGKEEPVRASSSAQAVTEEAVRLRELAANKGVYQLLRETCGGRIVEIPFRMRMSQTGIDEMDLSVRSSNGLMRAGVNTFGKLWKLMCDEGGLRSVRNLGAISEAEIRRCFLAACYAHLSSDEQAVYWQKILNAKDEDDPQIGAERSTRRRSATG